MPKPIVVPGDNAESKFLDEEQIGVSTERIGFPNIRGCQGVVCVMSSGTMVGAHFSGSTEAQVAAAMKEAMEAQCPGETIQDMYVAYNSKEKYSSAGDMHKKAELLNFQGDVKFFDTNKMSGAKQDGTYVELAKNASNNLEMSFKRNTKMAYEQGDDLVKNGMKQTVRASLAAGATKMHSAENKLKSVSVK